MSNRESEMTESNKRNDAPLESGELGASAAAPRGGGQRGDSATRVLQRLLWVFLAAVILATTLAVWALVMMSRGAGDQLERDGPLFSDPAPMVRFELTERSGGTFSDREFDDRISVVTFVFTRCTGFCPAMTQRKSELQAILAARPDADRFQLVTITVDPEHDTPEVLQEYADRHGADARRWLFLTGDPRYLYETVMARAFRLPVPSAFAAEEEHQIAHSDRFVLVDWNGGIRGYYEGLQDEGWRWLLEDIDRLAARMPVSP
ncbi:MAG: SCO family protein [Phycisphaeraceae bacterium]|nr:SCO family protein [Phycisphaeraceae bacterium]